MQKIFFLSWFFKTEAFHREMWSYVNTGVLSAHLQALLDEKKSLIEEGIETCARRGASIVTYMDQDYPDCFKHMERPPWVLTYIGELALLSESRKLSVVGSRRADPEALYWLNKHIKTLAADTVLISGGAIGVDQEVHKIAFREKYKTVCVLPVGIGELYPHSLKTLVKQFWKTCPESILLLSQFYPSQTVYKSSFYPRNYILSVMSDQLVVVQSEKKSGTMVTAKYALEHGKEIYTLPASPWDMKYSGNLKLLEDGAYQLIDLTLIHR